MTSGELLAESMMAHRAYRAAHDRGDQAAMREALTEAARLRREAVQADPNLTDVAFHDPRWPHAALLAFYEAQEAKR